MLTKDQADAAGGALTKPREEERALEADKLAQFNREASGKRRRAGAIGAAVFFLLVVAAYMSSR